MKKKIHLQYNALIYEFVKNNIKLKYRNSFLGIIWSMLDPLLSMIVLTFIFSNLFKNSIPNFPVYCLTGRLIYGFFSSVTKQCMKLITRYSGIIKKIYVSLYVFPLSTCISGFIIFLISLIPLFGLMIVTGVPFRLMNLAAIYPLLTVFAISLGTSLIIASLYVFFRDMEHIYSVYLLIVMYTSAIFYKPDIIAEKYRFLLHINPIYSVINVFRDCILYGRITESPSWIICAVYAVLYLTAGVYVFQKVQHKFIFAL